MNPFKLPPFTMRASIRFFLLACLMVAWLWLGCSATRPVDSATRPVEAAAPASKNLLIMAPGGGPAIGGYDPVSYFLDGEPRKGSQTFSYDWQDATWLFSKAEHRDLFKQDPAQYAPVYGGYCAAGMVDGYAAESDPVGGWAIHDGKLYLNWDADTLKEWLPEAVTQIDKSESVWPDVRRSLQDGTKEIYWHDIE
jgi:hypothetical protein